jgi:KipI family sensor histidine kinase inhibitor
MDVRILPAGDAAWLIEPAERIDAAINERASRSPTPSSTFQPPSPTSNLQLPTSNLQPRPPTSASAPIRDVVVGYRSVMVYVDPLDPRTDGIERRLREIAESPAPAGTVVPAFVEVPVCYDGSYGLDLGAVAAFGRCTPADVIDLHLGREYRVFVAGFVPGFAYMASVDPRIAAPRQSSPRLKVPAGSVAVAAGQTGVYPAETPGGWNVIGRCPVRPYDPDRGELVWSPRRDRVRSVHVGGRVSRDEPVG